MKQKSKILGVSGAILGFAIGITASLREGVTGNVIKSTGSSNPGKFIFAAIIGFFLALILGIIGLVVGGFFGE